MVIWVEETDDVMKANIRARKIFDRQNDPKYLPHLSLVYGNFSSSKKEEILSKIGRDFTTSFQVNRLTGRNLS